MSRTSFASLALVTGALSTGLLGWIGLSVLGAGCTFSKASDAPDTFIPIDEVGTTTDQQPTLTVFPAGSPADQPADLSCRGKPASDGGPITDAAYEAGEGGTAPSGELMQVPAKMFSFGTFGAATLGGVTFDVFWSNEIAGATPDQSFTTDPNGLVTLTVPAGYPFAFHVAAHDDPDPTKALKPYYEFDLVAPNPPGGATPMELNGVNLQEWNTLSVAITNQNGYQLPAGRAIFATRVVDCQRRYMKGATVEVIDVDSGQTLALVKDCTKDVCRIYMSDNEFPSLSSTWSSRSGLVVFADIPVTGATKHLRAIAKGIPPGETDPTTLATRDLEIADGAINVLYLVPQ